MISAASPEPGLRGPVVGNTSLSSINGDEGKLIYRGLGIHDLARNSTYEEICYLLWFSALPTRAHLEALRAKLVRRRVLPAQLVALLKDHRRTPRRWTYCVPPCRRSRRGIMCHSTNAPQT